jgi:hypothetical protein
MSWRAESSQMASTSRTVNSAAVGDKADDGLSLHSAHRTSQSQLPYPQQIHYSSTNYSAVAVASGGSTLLNSTSVDNSLSATEKRVGNVSNNEKRVLDGLHRSRPTPTAPSMFATSSLDSPHSTALELPPWPPSPLPEDTRKRNWFAVYDPALDPKKSKGKDIIYRYDGRPETVPGTVNSAPLGVKDPRIEARKAGKELTGRGMRKCRSAFYTLQWEVSATS